MIVAAFVEHGEIVMTTSGNALLSDGVFGGAIVSLRSTAETTFDPAPGRAVISLTGPASINGVEYGLASFDLCIITGPNFLSKVEVTGVAPFDSEASATNRLVTLFEVDYAPVPPETWPDTGLQTGCYTYEVNEPVGQGAGLFVEFVDGPDGLPVTLSAVKSAWTPDAAQP